MDTPPEKPGEQFSPLDLSESPVKSTPQRGNLTGNARVIRDLVADLHKLIQAWNDHHLYGYRAMKKIADVKLPLLRGACVGAVIIFPEGLEALCDELMDACDRMDETVGQMNLITHRMEAVVNLEKLRNRDDTPLFVSWGADKFVETCKQIHKAYKQELEVKECLASDAAHCVAESQIMMHLAAWVYQPFVCETVERNLQALLKETGHR